MMKQDFSCRSHQLEMMDGDAVGFEDFRKCLHDLEIVNVCTLAYRPTLHWLKRGLSGDKSRQPVSILDIGSGDSAVYNIGLEPASRARMADYITCVRSLIATGEGTYHGRPQRVRWHDQAERKHIPITLCAEGPKTLHLGGRICDGVALPVWDAPTPSQQ